MGISWQELVVVLLIVLVLFGPKRLPEVGSSLGRGLRGFKDALNGRDAGASNASTPTTTREVTTGSLQQPVPAPVPVEVVDPVVDEPR